MSPSAKRAAASPLAAGTAGSARPTVASGPAQSCGRLKINQADVLSGDSFKYELAAVASFASRMPGTAFGADSTLASILSAALARSKSIYCICAPVSTGSLAALTA